MKTREKNGDFLNIKETEIEMFLQRWDPQRNLQLKKSRPTIGNGGVSLWAWTLEVPGRI